MSGFYTILLAIIMYSKTAIYTSAYVPVLAYFGGRIAVVWRKSHEVAMPSAHPDIFTM
jgi:hypothetical protein